MHHSWVLSILFPNNSFGQFLNISPRNHIYADTSHLEFPDIEEWFTDQNSVPRETENRINLTLVINYRVYNEDIQMSPKNKSMLKATDLYPF